jgi:hypothetical protein
VTELSETKAKLEKTNSEYEDLKDGYETNMNDLAGKMKSL